MYKAQDMEKEIKNKEQFLENKFYESKSDHFSPSYVISNIDEDGKFHMVFTGSEHDHRFLSKEEALEWIQNFGIKGLRYFLIEEHTL